MFCTNCGKEIDDKAVVCVGCGVAIKNNANSEKSWIVTLLLCLFLGTLGVHRFYTGHIGSGIAQLILTITFFGIIFSSLWALIDLISIIVGNFKTKDGEELVK